MGASIVHSSVWRLVARQHGHIARWQLLELGFTHKAVVHRLARGRIFPTRYRGVYSVGRREVSRYGEWMAAVLACGPGAGLRHESAAALWGMRRDRPGPIYVSVPASRRVRQPGIRVLRCKDQAADITHEHNIPLTSPGRTLIDLERRFRPIARRAGLPPPWTQVNLNGFRVDFFWPELALVVETDGLRYHRTPAEQARDRVRDQALTAAGITVLRFTHAQVRYEPSHVERTLADVAVRLGDPS